MGHIKEIAKMGETHKDFDMKVFKVTIYVDGNDPRLKPAMSCNNEIILSNEDNVISIPLNAVFRSPDGEKYVYKKDGSGTVKQPIKTGPANEESIRVEDGLQEGDVILLNNTDENNEAEI